MDYYSAIPNSTFLSAETDECVLQGAWEPARFNRSTSFPAMLAFDNEATARCRFTGDWLAVIIPPCARWPGPKYGILRGRRDGREWNVRDARLEISIDGEPVQTLSILDAPLESLVATGLASGEHVVECRFSLQPGACGALSGFVFGKGEPAVVSVAVHGDYESNLNTVRLTLEDENGGAHANPASPASEAPLPETPLSEAPRFPISKIGRNPLSAKAAIIVPGSGNYRLTVQANGWETGNSESIRVDAGQTVALPPIYLRRPSVDVVCEGYGIIRPRLGQSVTAEPDTAFSAFLRLAGSADADAVESVALVSAEHAHPLSIVETTATEQFTSELRLRLHIPETIPDGLYDLRITFTGWADTAPSAVMVRRQTPETFRIFFFGHTNTWEQETAEYIDRLVDVANLLNPLFVIIANEVNGAYLSGSLRHLRMPCFVVAGNHSYPDLPRFFGPQVAAYDSGPCRILNFGRPWSGEWRHAVHLLEDEPVPQIRIINAYEPNAPGTELLKRCGVQLLFAGHAMGSAEPIDSTLIVGKANANSFRIVAVENGVPRLITCPDGPSGAFPLPRDAADPQPIAAAVEAALR